MLVSLLAVIRHLDLSLIFYHYLIYELTNKTTYVKCQNNYISNTTAQLFSSSLIAQSYSSLMSYLKTNVCSRSLPSSSSSTTMRHNFFFLKSRRAIFGQKNNPIFWGPSKTRIPVGVSPSEYSQPSLPWKHFCERSHMS